MNPWPSPWQGDALPDCATSACIASRHRGPNPGPRSYQERALPLSYAGVYIKLGTQDSDPNYRGQDPAGCQLPHSPSNQSPHPVLPRARRRYKGRLGIGPRGVVSSVRLELTLPDYSGRCLLPIGLRGRGAPDRSRTDHLPLTRGLLCLHELQGRGRAAVPGLNGYLARCKRLPRASRRLGSGSWGRTNVGGFRGRCPAIRRSRIELRGRGGLRTRTPTAFEAISSASWTHSPSKLCAGRGSNPQPPG